MAERSAFTPGDWYWTVAEDTSRAWSSAASAWVAAWPGDRLTRIASETELREVLRAYGRRGPGADPIDVTAERDRRLRRLPFAGAWFDFADGRGSDGNIAAAGTMALAAMIAGAKPRALRWADPDRDFAWRDADNRMHQMDAQTCLSLAQAAGRWKAAHMLAAAALKAQSPIPDDFRADQYWPVGG